MTRAPLAAYPALRLRRLRQSDWIRRLVRESALSPADLIWSVVVHEGDGPVAVDSMPGVSRLSLTDLAAAAREARDLGIPAIAVFPRLDAAKKDAVGSLAQDPDGLIARAVKAIKDAAPEIGVMCDVALDPYTDHGHDGVIRDGRIHNEATIERLVEQGLMQARAGCDILAPSDMMDGRCGALRQALEADGLTDVMIMSYAASSPRPSTARIGTRSALERSAPAARPRTRRATRWTRRTARRPCARSRSTSPRAPTWSWSSRDCRTWTSFGA